MDKPQGYFYSLSFHLRRHTLAVRVSRCRFVVYVAVTGSLFSANGPHRIGLAERINRRRPMRLIANRPTAQLLMEHEIRQFSENQSKSIPGVRPHLHQELAVTRGFELPN